MIVKSFPENSAVVFEKWVKQNQETNFRLSDHETKIILPCKTCISMLLFY